MAGSDTPKPAENLPVPPVERLPTGPIESTSTGGAHASDVAGAFARSTRAAYLADWLRWEAFASARGERALPAPAELVRDFLVAEAEAGRKLSVLRRRLAAIATVHRVQGARFDRG
jgi:hypothetical protein